MSNRGSLLKIIVKDIMAKKVIKKRNTSRDYVNGPTMHKALLDWYEQGDNAREPPELIVKAIIQICERLSTKHNFKNYTYIDEMEAEGVLACMSAIMAKKYNPYKYDNPFAYFTQIAWNAFITVIKKEHKETYIKHKELENHIIDANIRGENLDDYKMDDSGRIEKLINQFESNKNEPEED